MQNGFFLGYVWYLLQNRENLVNLQALAEITVSFQNWRID